MGFFFLFSEKLLYCYGKDFQLSSYFCFSIVAGFWLGHHESCFVLFGYVYCCLQCCWCCCIHYWCHGWVESSQKLPYYIGNGSPSVCISFSLQSLKLVSIIIY